MEKSTSPFPPDKPQFCRPDVKFLETSYKEKIPVCYVKAQRGGACGVPGIQDEAVVRDFFGSDTW